MRAGGLYPSRPPRRVNRRGRVGDHLVPRLSERSCIATSPYASYRAHKDDCNSVEQGPYWNADGFANSLPFMKTECSVSRSQEPAACPFPEPDQSTQSQTMSLRTILILSSHIRIGLPSGVFLAHTCNMSRFSIWSPPDPVWRRVHIKLLNMQSVPAPLSPRPC
jgi:hypothetical protein